MIFNTKAGKLAVFVRYESCSHQQMIKNIFLRFKTFSVLYFAHQAQSLKPLRAIGCVSALRLTFDVNVCFFSHSIHTICAFTFAHFAYFRSTFSYLLSSFSLEFSGQNSKYFSEFFRFLQFMSCKAV